MPTISAFKRRGYTPESLRTFADKVGVAKRDNVVDLALLEFTIREDLNKRAQRVMGVIRPLKVTITNYPDDKIEDLEAVNNPEDESMGKRTVPFCKEIYIEQDDFMEDPPKKFFRLSPGNEVRLRYAYIIKCEEVIKDENGNIVELKCTYDPETKSGTGTSNKKVKGTIHWVSAKHAVKAEVRLYDRLFNVEDPGGDKEVDFKEPFVKNAKPLDKFQFERLGYFCVDTKYTTDEKLVFNRTVTLRDTWAKMNKK
jgi:glutaminyl-tRNA synthetase